MTSKTEKRVKTKKRIREKKTEFGLWKLRLKETNLHVKSKKKMNKMIFDGKNNI